MNNYLIFQGEDSEIKYPCLLTAKNKKQAVDKYLNKCVISNDFIEHIHEWATNSGLAERFFYHEKSEGQKSVSKKYSERKICEYFYEKHEYGKLFLEHWYSDSFDENKNEYGINQMKKFPDEMIRYIWIKEMKKQDHTYWTKLNIVNLDSIPALN